MQLKTHRLLWAKRAGTVGHVETQVLVEKSAYVPEQVLTQTLLVVSANYAFYIGQILTHFLDEI